MTENLQKIIENAFENIDTINDENQKKSLQQTVAKVLAAMGNGTLRVAQQQQDGSWKVNTWLKKAILLYFKIKNMSLISGAPDGTKWWDKIEPKFSGWQKQQFEEAAIRAVPASFVREASYIAPKVVLMPCFVNIGAYIGEKTMIDTWATIGSCAQIGKNVHISGGAGIGGVLEPLQSNPVIIEDDCFIGARSEVAEGVIVKKGAVLSMGVYIGASTKIVDRNTGEICYGQVPEYSVVVPGTMPAKSQKDGQKNVNVKPSLYCAVIIKKVDARTRAKVSINQLLRD